MSKVLVNESDAEPILCKLQCKLCKQLLSPSKSADACRTKFKITVCKIHHFVLEEGLISKEQQHRAAAGNIKSMGFKRQATCCRGQIHSQQETRALQTLPSRKSSGYMVRGRIYI